MGRSHITVSFAMILVVALRFECDGYVAGNEDAPVEHNHPGKTGVEVDDLTEALSSTTISNAPARHTGTPHIKKGGQCIPQEQTIEIKPEASKRRR